MQIALLFFAIAVVLASVSTAVLVVSALLDLRKALIIGSILMGVSLILAGVAAALLLLLFSNLFTS